MPSNPNYSFPRFAVRVRSGGKTHVIDGNTPTKKATEVAQPDCQIDGWFLQAPETSVHGIRAQVGDEEITAQRKQLRPDILRRFPDHPDALLSGFKVDVQLRAGLNKLQLQL